MLIEEYSLEVFTPPCDPGSERFAAFAWLTVGIGDVLPYLNATLRGAIYNAAAPALTWKQGGHSIAFHPFQIAVSNLPDRQAATEELEGLVRLVNDTWERRAEIEPDQRARQRPGLMEVYKLLPRTSCKACGEASCFLFAGKLVVGQARLDGCPVLGEPAYAEQQARLEEMAWGAD